MSVTVSRLWSPCIDRTTHDVPDPCPYVQTSSTRLFNWTPRSQTTVLFGEVGRAVVNNVNDSCWVCLAYVISRDRCKAAVPLQLFASGSWVLTSLAKNIISP